jgi:hypothetical protein
MQQQGFGFVADAAPPAVMRDGATRKRDVLKRLAEVNGESLDRAREIARRLLVYNGNAGIIADDVRAEFVAAYGEESWSQWAGALFRSSAFEPTGNFRPSKLARYHANMRREWRLAD